MGICYFSILVVVALLFTVFQRFSFSAILSSNLSFSWLRDWLFLLLLFQQEWHLVSKAIGYFSRSSTSSFRVHYHRSTVFFQQLRRVWQFGNTGQNELAVISFTVIVVERSANWFLTHQEWSNNLIVFRDLLKKYTRFRWHSAANAAMLFAANIWRRLHVPEPRLLSDELSTCCRSG